MLKNSYANRVDIAAIAMGALIYVTSTYQETGTRIARTEAKAPI